MIGVVHLSAHASNHYRRRWVQLPWRRRWWGGSDPRKTMAVNDFTPSRGPSLAFERLSPPCPSSPSGRNGRSRWSARWKLCDALGSSSASPFTPLIRTDLVSRHGATPRLTSGHRASEHEGDLSSPRRPNILFVAAQFAVGFYGSQPIPMPVVIIGGLELDQACIRRGCRAARDFRERRLRISSPWTRSGDKLPTQPCEDRPRAA